MIVKAGTLDRLPFVYVKKQCPATTYGICINCGSCDDPEGMFGIAHFLEHIIFRSDPAQLIIKKGGRIQAVTEREKTTYICQIPDDEDDLFNNFLRFIFNPKFDPEIFYSEKRNVEKEYRTIHQTEITKIVEALYNIIFRNCSFGNPIIGYPSSINRLTINDVISFHKMYYIPSNIFIMQTGGRINILYRTDDKNVSRLQKTSSVTYSATNQEIPKFEWEIADSDNNIFLLGFPINIFSDHEKYILSLIKQIMALSADEYYQKISEQSTFSDQFAISCNYYRNVSILFCLIAGDDKMSEALFTELRVMLRKLTMEKISQRNITDAQRYQMNHRKIMLSDPLNEMSIYLYDLLNCNNIEQFKSKLNSKDAAPIDPGDISSLARRLFGSSNMFYYAKCKDDLRYLPNSLFI